MTGSLPPLSLYLHFPWCRAKCPYCDFNSHQGGDEASRRRYISALLADLRQEAEFADGRPIESIFLGGGTPSVFAPAEIATVLQASARLFELARDCEITMEANPGTVGHGTMRAYRDAGVNRLSIGAQSFNAASLVKLGRIHGPDEIRASYAEACRAGFDSINLDLMFALPGQTVADAEADIDALLGLGPPHVSYYQLTLEPNTVFFARPPADLPDEDAAWAMQTVGHAKLADAGYAQYEISAFAKSGARCRHNLNYWQFGDYLAAGAGAHGKVTRQDQEIWRYRKVANPLLYMEKIESGGATMGETVVSGADRSFEYMLNVLRLADGFSEKRFERRTGLPATSLRPALERARQDGLMAEVSAGVWRPTPFGFRYLNDLQARFLPDRAEG